MATKLLSLDFYHFYYFSYIFSNRKSIFTCKSITIQNMFNLFFLQNQFFLYYTISSGWIEIEWSWFISIKHCNEEIYHKLTNHELKQTKQTIHKIINEIKLNRLNRTNRVHNGGMSRMKINNDEIRRIWRCKRDFK